MSEIYIIETEKQTIPWSSLNEYQIYNLLKRELGEMVFQFDFDQQIRAYSEILATIDNIEKSQQELIDILYKENWIQPSLEGAILYTTNIAKNVLNSKVILDNTLINISGLTANLKHVGKNNVNIVNYKLLLNINRLFNREFPIKFSASSFTSANIGLLLNLRFHICDLIINFDTNTLKFDENQLIAAKDAYTLNTKIKQVIPPTLINQRELVDISKAITIYGEYYSFGSLSDLFVNRVHFLSSNYYIRSAIPFYTDLLNTTKSILRKINIIKTVNKNIENEKNKQREREVIQDLLEYAIVNQFGEYLLTKIKEGKAELTEAQRRILDKYVINQNEQDRRYKANTCGHIPIRVEYDNTENLLAKQKLFTQLLKGFGKNGFDPATHFIICSTCGFVIGCEHEAVLYSNANDIFNNIKDYEQRTLDQIECKYCGRKIGDLPLEMNLEFDEEGRKNVGIVIEKDNIDINILKENINNVLRFLGLTNKFNMFTILDYIGSYVFEKFIDIEKKQLSSDRTAILKKIQALGYIFAYFIIKQVGSFKDIKDDYKQARKMVYTLISDRDPAFIKLIESQDLQAVFINAIERARIALDRGKPKVQIAKKIYGYKQEKILDKLVPIIDPIKLIESNKEYKIRVNMGLPLLGNRIYYKYEKMPLIKMANNLKTEITAADYAKFDNEIKAFINTACAGIKDKINFEGIELNCEAKQFPIEAIRKKILEKKKESIILTTADYKVHYKPHAVEIKPLAFKDVEHLAEYFEGNILIIRNFIDQLNIYTLLENMNIIHRFIREYRRIHFGEYPNSPSTKYIEQYIHEKKKFTVNLVFNKHYNILNYISEVVKNKLVAEFVINFIKNVQFSQKLGKITENDMVKFDNDIEKQYRENYELFGKMTPEEKIALGFAQKGVEEGIAILTDLQKKEELEQFDEQIEVNQEQQNIMELNRDDLQSFDDGDEAFITGSFEVYN